MPTPEEFARRMARRERALAKEVSQSLVDIGARWVDTMQDQLRRNRYVRGRRKSIGQPAGTRTGALARNISFELRPGPAKNLADLPGLTLVAYARKPLGEEHNYVRTLEYGTRGPIRPRRGRYLAIPLDDALTPRGQLRVPPRSWNDTFFFTSRSGNVFLAQREGGRGGRLKLLFLMRESIPQQPPRLHLRRNFVKTVSGFGRTRIRKALKAARAAV